MHDDNIGVDILGTEDGTTVAIKMARRHVPAMIVTLSIANSVYTDPRFRSVLEALIVESESDVVDSPAYNRRLAAVTEFTDAVGATLDYWYETTRPKDDDNE